MELKLNFKLGSKTINNRLYNLDDLKTEFDRILKEAGHISIGPDNEHINKQDGSVPDDVLVGIVKKYRIDEDGTVFFDVDEMSEQTVSWLEANPDVMKLTLFGFGNINSEGLVADFKLGCLFMTQDQG